MPLRRRRSLDGLGFVAYGFPECYETSVHTRGELGKAVGLERVQVAIRNNELLVQTGFSGAAVWSDKLGAAVGMLTARDSESAGRVAFAVPMRTIAAYSMIVTAALQTPLDLIAIGRHIGDHGRVV